jgi:hypothetical protein
LNHRIADLDGVKINLAIELKYLIMKMNKKAHEERFSKTKISLELSKRKDIIVLSKYPKNVWSKMELNWVNLIVRR